MTPSELRAVSELLLVLRKEQSNGIDADDTVKRLFPGQTLEQALDKCERGILEMARHILSTVREDELEAISDEWWRTLSHAWFADLDGDEKLCLLVHDNIHDDADCRLLAVFSDDGSWGFWEQRRDTNELCNPHHNRFKPVKTRGQVRDLCRVLGIELKETP